MDKENAEAYKVFVTQGKDAFVKHVFTDQNDPNKEKKLSYAEMRMKYG